MGQRAELVFPSGHSGDVEAVSISASGRFLLSASSDGTLKTWDIASGLTFKTYRGHEDNANVYAADFSHKTDSFFISGGQDNRIIVWNTYTGEPLKVFEGHQGPVTVVTISKDDQYILSGSNDKTAKLWDIKKGICVKTFRGHQQVVRAVAFTDDMKHIVTASGLPSLPPMDNSIKLWDIETEKEIRKIGEHEDVINTMSIRGNYVISGSDDATIRIWGIDKEEEIKEIQENSLVTAIALSKDGKYVLAGTAKGAIHLWNLVDKKVERTFRSNKYKASVRSIIWDSESGYFFSVHDANIVKWSTLDGDIHNVFQGYNQPAYALACSQSGKFIASSNIQEGISLWNMQTGRIIRGIASNLLGANRLLLSKDDRYLYASYFSGREKNPILRYDLENGDSSMVFQGHESIVNSIALSPSHDRMASCSEDGIIIWNTSTSGIFAKVTDQPQTMALAWSPSGDTLCSADLNGTILLRDARGKVLHTLLGSKSRIMMIQFSPNGRYLLSGGGPMRTAELILWDVQKGSIVRRFEPPHTGFINSVAFSQDGRQVVSGAFDGSICLWNIEQKEMLQKWEAHNSFLTDVAFSPDGKYIVSSSGDNTLKIWEQGNTHPILTFFKLDSEEWGIVTADNYYSCSHDLAQKIGFKVEDKIFRFEQFDLKYNRPDKIADRMPQKDSIIVRAFKNAYQTRLEKMDFKEDKLSDIFYVPQLKITNQHTENGQIIFDILAYDSIALLDRLFVYVNDVPVYGMKGIDLRIKSTQKHTQTLSVELSPGANKIQVSVLNQAGVESLKETIYATHTTSTYKPRLWVVGIGCEKFVNKNKNLQYPVKDMGTLTEFFKKNKALYDTLIIDTLLDYSVTIENIQKIRKHLDKTNPLDRVIVFIAGHGLFDADYNYYFATPLTDFNAPQKSGIPYNTLESLLDGIPARQKLMLVDACHAGEIDKKNIEKIKQNNTQLKPNIFIRSFGYDSLGHKHSGLDNAFEVMKALFVDLRRGTGATSIASAAGVEFAREGDDWKSSVFLYALLQGLEKGTADTNGDNKIMVSELQDYLARSVIELTNGLQRPEFRTENISNDWQIW
jgi:WD40 repeat protein